MNSPFRELLIAFVVIFGVVWILTSQRSTRVKTSEPLASSLLHSLLLLVGFLIMFLKRFQVGLLAERWIPQSLAVEVIGVVLAALGVGFAIWARAILGTNWNDRVSINEGQQLVQSGPYAIVRNPIYTGVIFFMLGAALTLGELVGLLGLALVFISVWDKARTEEKFLRTEFGERYLEYQERVRFLLPFIF